MNREGRFQRWPADSPVADRHGSVSRSAPLAELRTQFYHLAGMEDRQAAGLVLEVLLRDLFQLFALDPHASFRVTGEQIDGSFMLADQVYLLEAKWTGERVAERDLLVFRGVVEGKSAITRGIFISISGFTPEALEAISRGKQPNFFLVDGYDLVAVLEGQMALDELLRKKLRALAERGRVFVSAKEILG